MSNFHLLYIKIDIKYEGHSISAAVNAYGAIPEDHCCTDKHFLDQDLSMVHRSHERHSNGAIMTIRAFLLALLTTGAFAAIESPPPYGELPPEAVVVLQAYDDTVSQTNVDAVASVSSQADHINVQVYDLYHNALNSGNLEGATTARFLIHQLTEAEIMSHLDLAQQQMTEEEKWDVNPGVIVTVNPSGGRQKIARLKHDECVILYPHPTDKWSYTYNYGTRDVTTHYSFQGIKKATYLPQFGVAFSHNALEGQAFYEGPLSPETIISGAGDVMLYSTVSTHAFNSMTGSIRVKAIQGKILNGVIIPRGIPSHITKLIAEYFKHYNGFVKKSSKTVRDEKRKVSKALKRMKRQLTRDKDLSGATKLVNYLQLFEDQSIQIAEWRKIHKANVTNERSWNSIPGEEITVEGTSFLQDTQITIHPGDMMVIMGSDKWGINGGVNFKGTSNINFNGYPSLKMIFTLKQEDGQSIVGYPTHAAMRFDHGGQLFLHPHASGGASTSKTPVQQQDWGSIRVKIIRN